MPFYLTFYLKNHLMNFNSTMQVEAKKGIKIGCCGIPEAKRKYFKEFPVVEVQQTFYQPPKLETLQNWRKQAPEKFEFTLKAWQLITHLPSSPTYRKLKEPISNEQRNAYGCFKPTDEVFAAWERIFQCANALKATKIIFQCPVSFKPIDDNIRNMEYFFQQINRADFIFCWEPRGNWSNEIISNLCQKLNLVHCVDPFVNTRQAGSLKYFRLHGIGSYQYQYSYQDFERLVQFCEGEQQVYCMFNNIAMLQDARLFLKKITAG